MSSYTIVLSGRNSSIVHQSFNPEIHLNPDKKYEIALLSLHGNLDLRYQTPKIKVTNDNNSVIF